MKILAFADLHGRLRLVSRLLEVSEEADIVVCCGDLSDLGRGLNEVSEILSRICKPFFIVPGNNEGDFEVDRICKRFSWVNLHGRSFRVGEYVLAGVGGSPPTPFQTPFELEDREIGRVLEACRGKKHLILVTHAPPFGTKLDEIAHGEHVGSTFIRKFIEEEKPLLNVCGHVHEKAGAEDMVGPTKLINPGPSGTIIKV